MIGRPMLERSLPMPHRFAPAFVAAVLTAFASAFLLAAFNPSQAGRGLPRDGIVRVKSSYPLDETVTRLKTDIGEKGIQFFDAIDQSKLGADAGIKLNPSTLLVFGNPPLGIQFLTANPYAGLDWPVRLLVTENGKGEVWLAYTDFNWIAHRHGIANRGAQFKMASEVIVSITSSVVKR